MSQTLVRSLEYIESNLGSALDLDQIAAAANLSRYHYSRMFRTLTNESVMGYVRKRRLSIAAHKLVTEKCPVIDVAYAVGYDSPEAFSRAFKRMFGIAPLAFKELGKPVWANFRRPLDAQKLAHLHERMTMEPVIKTYPAFKIVGMYGRYTAETNTQIPALWNKFSPLMDSIPNRTSDDYFGICVPINTPEFDYYCAVEVSNFDNVPESLASLEIAQQHYAVFTHKGSLEGLRDTVAYIWGTWLPESKYRSLFKPDFELYSERFDLSSKTSELDLYMPIERPV